MAGFKNFKDLVDTEENFSRYSTWRKVPTQTTGAGVWFDLSMSPGNPVPQYYAASPTIAIALSQSTDWGLYHSPAVSPKDKFLRKLTAITTTAAATPLSMILCDYLMYYPFIDESITDPQPMTTNISLPRYPSGEGVQMMAVVVASQTGGQTFQVTYTNSKGVGGRVSQTVVCNTQVVNGTVLTSAPATANAFSPFIPLQVGDTGINHVDSVQMNGADVGLFSLVLVKPLASFAILDITAPVEVDFLKDYSIMPEIQDDAYLNFICCPNGSLSGAPIIGDIKFTWR